MAEKAPEHLYVSTDGTNVPTREEEWKEMKSGAFYTTTAIPPQQQSDSWEVQAQEISFHADFADPERFGKALWLEGHRRGITQAQEMVAIGDGAQGKVEEVIQHCLEQTAMAVAGEAFRQAGSYYLNTRERMRYPEYRARGIQIGSGTVESGCKHVI